MLFKTKKRYEVRTAGDEVLKETAKPVAAITPEIRDLAQRMVESMEIFDGIGLAAPQIGVLLRMVALDVPPADDDTRLTQGELALCPLMPLVIVNPEILFASAEVGEREEGCLSVPDIYAPVVRPQRVMLRAQTLDGQLIECECGNLLGRCIQHELDHLDGILFVDRLTREAAAEVARPLDQLLHYGSKHNFKRVKIK